MRYSNRTEAWAHAWRAYYGQCTGHDQECAYKFMRTKDIIPHPKAPRLQSAWGQQVWMGVLPPR